MRKISPIKTKYLIKLCERLGWKKERQKGDHLCLIKQGMPRPIVILIHKMSPPWIIVQTIKNLGIKRDEYFKLLKEIR